MKIAALVPVKPFEEAKTRLAPVFSPLERSRLARVFFHRTLTLLGECPSIEQRIVVSRDTEVLREAEALGALSALETGGMNLNAALDFAATRANALGMQAIVSVPTDLPGLTGDVLREFLAQAVEPPIVLVTPDLRETGTTLVMMSPIGVIPFAYGQNSRERFADYCHTAGIPILEFKNIEARLDADYPHDLMKREMQISKIINPETL